ncbi:MAG: hypothetical protein IH991_06575 [Planctomycetes bacterium]|nr:hypothetical protein [Planctomycetota bacterium]
MKVPKSYENWPRIRQRQIIVARFVNRKTQNEIAVDFGVSFTRSRSRQWRAVKVTHPRFRSCLR